MNIHRPEKQGSAVLFRHPHCKSIIAIQRLKQSSQYLFHLRKYKLEANLRIEAERSISVKP